MRPRVDSPIEGGASGGGWDTREHDRRRDHGVDDGWRSPEQEEPDGDPESSQDDVPQQVEGGKRNGGDLLDEAMEMTDGDVADGGGALGTDEEQMEPSNPEGFRGRDGAAAMTPLRWNRITTEPGAAVRPMVPGGAEGRSSYGRGVRAMSRGEVTESAAGGGARGSTRSEGSG